ncbi:unnamed protein product [Trifolium pratense]|nr:unnamed protein product [Trifolium pratense]
MCLWIVKSNFIPGQENSIEMVLIDEKGSKIHATVRRHLIHMFKGVLIEGEAYTLSTFSVVEAYGLCRPTRHPCRLFFHSTTLLERVECPLIKKNGLSLMDIGKINSHTCDSNYLVDLIGVMSGISSLNEFTKNGERVKMIVIELSDPRGDCHVVLFGGIVDYLIQMMRTLQGGLPVVVVQFAKIRFFRGRVLLQNIQDVTKLWLNPAVEDAVLYGRRLNKMRGGPTTHVPLIGPGRKPSLGDEFLHLYPKKTIADLKFTLEDGPFIVSAVIDGLVEGEDWWFPSCRCSKRLIPNAGFYYCRSCSKHVFHVVPRFCVKVHVTDGIEDAMFVLSDDAMCYLIRTKCSVLVSSYKGMNRVNPPDVLKQLEGLKLLFKVVTVSSLNPIYKGCFKVARVCVDAGIIKSFSNGGIYHTPEQLVYKSGIAEIDEPFILGNQHIEHGDIFMKRSLNAAFENAAWQEDQSYHKRSRDY